MQIRPQVDMKRGGEHTARERGACVRIFNYPAVNNDTLKTVIDTKNKSSGMHSSKLHRKTKDREFVISRELDRHSW